MCVSWSVYEHVFSFVDIGGLGRAVSRRDAVRQLREIWPVKTGAEVMWDRWCGMNRGKEVEVQGVQVRRHGRRVWIAGGGTPGW